MKTQTQRMKLFKIKEGLFRITEAFAPVMFFIPSLLFTPEIDRKESFGSLL